MKSVCKLVLVVFLFTSAVFADDGNMGNGGRTCPTGQTTCFVANEPIEPGTMSTDTEDSEDSVLTIVQNYLDSVLDYFAVPE
jgi:hypothetical protein